MKNPKLVVAFVISGLVVFAFVWTIRIARLFGVAATSYWWQATFAVSVIVFGFVGAMYWWSSRPASGKQNRDRTAV